MSAEVAACYRQANEEEAKIVRKIGALFSAYLENEMKQWASICKIFQVHSDPSLGDTELQAIKA